MMDVFQQILAAIPMLLVPQVILGMVGGTVLGIAIGALPGLSATMGIAVVIPITFVMEPLVALGMIAGIYNGAMYGGAIPTILLRIPGSPASIATIFDGYPMAQQGRGRLALRIALVSSAIGGAASAVALLLLAPPLSSISLLFGPKEYFWLMVFALTTIAVVLEGSPVKGLISACFGLLLGLVGLDAVSGANRFTFGQPELYGGFNIIVLLTGLYAIPPTLELARNPRPVIVERPDRENDIATFRWSRLVPAWVRSSLIGIVAGILPGLGGNAAALISWNEQRRSSKEPERYGKGAPEGVAAAECANNADNAASLIPAITLGIPGNAVAAVIMGAMLVHGLRPGPQLLTTDGPIVYAFMLSMLVTSGLVFLIGRFGATAFIRLLGLPPALISPMIVGLTVVGVYSIENSMFSVWLMLGLGLVGYWMNKFSIPAAPAVLAVILGPTAEAEFRRALLISRGDTLSLFSGPIALGIITLTVLVVGYSVVRALRGRKENAAKSVLT